MSAYSTVGKCAGRMAQYGGLSASTHPTVDEATDILEDIASQINAVLASKGLSVPVTAPAQFVTFLGAVNTWGAVAEILKSRFPDATGPGETPAYALFERRYQDALKGLADGSLIPSDVGRSEAAKPSTYFTRNPDTDEDLGANAEPLFTMDMQW